MTWADFKTAINDCLLTHKDRRGITAFKEQQYKSGVLYLQGWIERYRQGHEDTYEPSDLSVNGFASQGTLPENCTPTEAWIIRKKSGSVSNTVEVTDDEITVTAHGIEASDTEPGIVNGKLTNSGGALPAGLEENRYYYLRVVDADTLTLHTTAAGALDNTDRVDITGDGTGTTTLTYDVSSHPCDVMPWNNRKALIEGQACVNGGRGIITFNPHGDEFLIYPLLETLDADDKTQVLELTWNGLKVDFDDDDDVPFDDLAVSPMVEFLFSKINRHVDGDLQGAGVATASFLSEAARLYLANKDQRPQ
jgi:hypothetical protein